jgi:hypothetical protein
MYNCRNPVHVNALQSDENITTIDYFHRLPFSLIAYLDVLGIALGIVLGVSAFDYLEAFRFDIGKIDKFRTTSNADLAVQEGEEGIVKPKCTKADWSNYVWALYVFALLPRLYQSFLILNGTFAENRSKVLRF